MSRGKYLLILLGLIALSLAASPTSFCKCTCFTNSTIIPLDAPQSSSTPSGSSPPKSRTCNDCNKQFCRDYNLNICAEATDDDIFTTCFQRDSFKDEAVVFIFILATVGLLTWAAVKPWLARWREQARLGRYNPVVGNSS